MAYHFIFRNSSQQRIELPIPPSELTMTKNAKNSTINLINGGNINVLKSPELEEIEFEFILPFRQYPFANTSLYPIKYYTDFFEDCLDNKKPLEISISRYTPKGDSLFKTVKQMAIETFSLNEKWENGFDVTCKIKFKEYKYYGTKKYPLSEKKWGDKIKVVDNETKRPTKDTQKTYTVVKNDTLSLISKKVYGSSSHWKKIYTTNKTLIENTAKKNGKNSSQNGKWIYPKTVLIIPKL